MNRILQKLLELHPDFDTNKAKSVVDKVIEIASLYTNRDIYLITETDNTLINMAEELYTKGSLSTSGSISSISEDGRSVQFSNGANVDLNSHIFKLNRYKKVYRTE